MIYTDKKQINTDPLKSASQIRGNLLYADITYKVRGAIFSVYNTLGYGHKKQVYQKDDKVIIELKAVEFMPKTFETQLLHYLKTTGFQLGLLVNFGSSRLQIKRLVWTKGGSL